MSVSYPDLNLTTFPESVDIFVQMLDVVASDAAALTAYQNAMEAGNITQANSALGTMVNATQKLLTAEKINRIFDSIEALERFLATDIIPYVTQLQSSWQSEINKFAYVGVYNSSQTYSKNNIVSYTVGAYTFLYLCLEDANVGITPTNTGYWQQFTVVGLQGLSGENMSYLYEWNNTTVYSPQDCVTHNNKLWGCLVSNNNSEPVETNANWQLLADLSASVYPVQSEQPVAQDEGEIWFQVIGSEF